MSKTLDELFIQFGSDKSSQHHGYSPTYERLMRGIRDDLNFMLILGVGGYHFTDRGGADLRSFAEYMPETVILGLDIYNKSFLNGGRIRTEICNQTDKDKLEELLRSWGTPNIIIDDASHFNGNTIESFQILWSKLRSGGVYVIEDIEGSWYEEHGFGGNKDQSNWNHPSTINFFRKLLNSLNKKYIENYKVEFEGEDSIESIEFLKNMIIIKKKENAN